MGGPRKKSENNTEVSNLTEKPADSKVSILNPYSRLVNASHVIWTLASDWSISLLILLVQAPKLSWLSCCYFLFYKLALLHFMAMRNSIKEYFVEITLPTSPTPFSHTFNWPFLKEGNFTQDKRSRGKKRTQSAFNLMFNASEWGKNTKKETIAAQTS